MTPTPPDHQVQSPSSVIPTGFLEPICHTLNNDDALQIIQCAIEDELGVSEHELRMGAHTAIASLARHVLYRMAHVQFCVHASVLARYVDANYQTVLKSMRNAWKGHFRSRGDKFNSADFVRAYNRVLSRVSLMCELLEKELSVTDSGYISSDISNIREKTE